MTAQRRQFTQEFKASAVRLVTEEGYKVSEAARNLDIGVSELRSRGCTAGFRVNRRPKVELARLKKENHPLKLEREILKKAAAFFAKQSGTGIN